MTIVIVESPVKAKTFQAHLNSVKKDTYKVIASVGHIKDLPKNDMGIDIVDGKFNGHYQLIPGKSKFVNEIKKYVKDGSDIFICTDDDREGERICDDIVKECNIKSYYRYAPRSLDKKTIIDAIVKKTGIREIDEKVVRGQMVRREADRILGYGLSPIIRFVAKDKDFKVFGTGRVEAIALDIIYERHKKIEEYKSNIPLPTDIIKATYKINGIPFELIGEKLEFSKTENEALEESKHIARSNPHVVTLVESEIVDKNPPPPLITSSLYASASYLFGFEPEKTKKLAQDLFHAETINYPRTDSYMLTDETYKKIIQYLLNETEIDKNDIKEKKREYTNKKGAQAAHEAIRPIHIDKEHSPENILPLWKYGKLTNKLTEEHHKIYELIWIYTISTQLEASQYKQTEVVVKSGPLTFKGKSNESIDKGWEKYYGLQINESLKGLKDSWREKEIIYPEDIYVGKVLQNVIIDSYERPSRSPKRISEGMLIGMLETLQVARPSTMHTISSKLISKGYITSNANLFGITHSGEFVAEFNQEHAHELIDRKKAAEFEETIVKIEEGAITDTNAILKEYWNYIEDIKQRVGYVEFDKREPTEAQLKKAKYYYDKLSKEQQAKVSSDTFDTFVKISKFIEEHASMQLQDELHKAIGNCPKCKKKSIVEKEKVFACVEKKCEFVLYKSNILKFFSSMDKEFSNDELVKIVATLLQDKVVLIRDLNTQFGTQDSYFEIKYSKKYKSYSLSFLPKDKKEDLKDSNLGLWEQFTKDSLAKQTSNQEHTKNSHSISERKDQITNAFNKITFEEDLQKLIKLKDSKKINNKISSVLFDIDGFKNINEQYGYEVGDKALNIVADTCFKALEYYKANGNVYRYGGGKFMLLFYGHDKDNIVKMAEMIKRSIATKNIKVGIDYDFSLI